MLSSTEHPPAALPSPDRAATSSYRRRSSSNQQLKPQPRRFKAFKPSIEAPFGRSSSCSSSVVFSPSRQHKEDVAEPEADPERDQQTVFAYQISSKAERRDVYDFFSSCGKVRDVSSRSQGVWYIEYFDSMSVPKQ